MSDLSSLQDPDRPVCDPHFRMSGAGILPLPERWCSLTPVPYLEAVHKMEERVQGLLQAKQPELIWFLEHPPLYTAGRRAQPQDLLNPYFPVYQTGRGGQWTYHGPGQRVIYVLLDLKKRVQDLRSYVWHLESWVLISLKEIGLQAERRAGSIGVWASFPNGDQKKIAAIGVRIKKWITFHGISLNVHPNLDHYAGIIPCGIHDHGVTSIQDLGVSVSLTEIDQILTKNFKQIF